MALAGDACIVTGGRAGTISEACLAWLHERPLPAPVAQGGCSAALPANPCEERRNSPILPSACPVELEAQVRVLALAGDLD